MSNTHIRCNLHFEDLRELQVRFYDEASTLAPLISPRPDALQRHNAQSVAELLEIENLDGAFECEDDEDIYGSPIEEEDQDDDLF